jgi:hypothetical protein
MRKAPRDLEFFMTFDKATGDFEPLDPTGGEAGFAQFRRQVNRRGFLLTLAKEVFRPGIDYLDQATFVTYLCIDDRVKTETQARDLFREMVSHCIIEIDPTNPNFVFPGDSFPLTEETLTRLSA